MFTIDNNGKARRIRSEADIMDIDREQFKLIDKSGKIIIQKISKEDLIRKLF
ncbi:hypothetical protein J2755_000296 [Methanohalophilus levihalophilus]|uniref:hypothetical protein n=1 Tax=Methanohalophilus levihalophilus TaxID=1431282 RepID=UPI001AE8290F|nr:hypothetical protein [Methanohalophilus levihalophilus]MBP2029376.1 hypothetical protein [Methanohalophilus levihalophilus]